ncbi:HesA/MoeB/ThiF family protein [Neptunicella sp. SCSIO 80796]|uniref:HesA/MoeB/ThiF family protein n=1 Tax=Neptunicella plasticusilytica TaxID=3117012 RepID=UPI003A4D7B3A
MSLLSDKEFIRYNRQIMLEQIGEPGQVKFKRAHVMIVGMGGLGCPAALYLAASGIGSLTLIDHDVIELSNLQRQILYSQQDIGRAKVEVAQQALTAINPMIEVETINDSLFNLVPDALQGLDMVLDCTDNPEARRFINQFCYTRQLKLVSASAIQGQGQLISFDFARPDSPCYQCLFPVDAKQKINCASSGVISPLLGVMGSLQASSALQLLLGDRTSLNRLITVNSLSMQFKRFNLPKDPNCQCCSTIVAPPE